MANLTRVIQKIFASDSGVNGITKFGSKAGGTAEPTTNPAEVQTTRFLEGWLAATLAGTRFLPTYQDMNAVQFLLSRQIAYILQKGIPEYDAETDYYINDIVREAGTTDLYASLTDNNVGNALSDGTKWEFLVDLADTMQGANNLSDLANASTARTNLGVAIGTDVQAQDPNLQELADLTFVANKLLGINSSGDLELREYFANNNLAINGDFSIAQTGTSFTSATTPANNDDTYLFDQFINLSDGNDIIDSSQELTIKPVGVYSALKIDQETANKQWGIVQIIEAKDAAAIIGGTASLSFSARKGASNVTVENLRAALISWDGTADVVTSDVVGTWNGAGTNPALASNWTYENIPSNLLLTDSYQKFKIENIAIDTASTKNVALFIWLDDVDATVGDLVYISEIKVEQGAVATPFTSRLFAEELGLCQRYFEKSYNLDVAIGAITDVGQFVYTSITSSQNLGNVSFATKKRVTPTMTAYSPTTGTAGKILQQPSTERDANFTGQGQSSFNIFPNTNWTATGNAFVHWTANSRL